VTPASPGSVTITPDTGTAFHVSPTDFHLPHFTGTQSGVTIELDVVLDPTNNLTGTYDPATGTMTTNPANFDATIALSGLFTGTCVMDVTHGNPIPMSFSTEATSPYLGDRFDPLSDPPVNGAIVSSWTDLPASTQTSGSAGVCAFVDGLKGGPGGVWLSNGIATPSRPAPPPPSGGGTISAPAQAAPTGTPAQLKKCIKKAKKKYKNNPAKKKKAIKKCKRKFG
jgi:hypothetical protein